MLFGEVGNVRDYPVKTFRRNTTHTKLQIAVRCSIMGGGIGMPIGVTNINIGTFALPYSE